MDELSNPPQNTVIEDQNGTSNIPTSPISQNRKSGLFIKLAVLLILVLLIAGVTSAYFSYKQQIETAAKPVITKIIKELTPTPTTDPTLQWKTFNEQLNRFSFKYPTDFVVNEEPTKRGGVTHIILKSSREEFKFTIGPKDSAGIFSNFSTGDTQEINGILWIDIFSSDYCDPANCRATALGDYVLHNDYFVAVTQSNRINDKSSLNQILSTFKFTDTIEKACNSNSDCTNGSSCITIGPIIQGQQIKKVCSQPGKANPL